jgi:hypothetical protein
MSSLLLAVAIGCILITVLVAIIASVVGLFLIGVMAGWMGRNEIYQLNYSNLHPEFFDENGNVISDKIFTVKFEENDDTDEDSEEDDD